MHMDIFNDDAFSVMRMSRGLSERRYVPSRIGQLGLFDPESIDTTTFAIEKEVDGSLVLVASSPRGGPGQTIGGEDRNLRMLRVPHFQRDDSVNADEVREKAATCWAMALAGMASSGSNASVRPRIFAVPGMNCISPAAPARELACTRPLDSLAMIPNSKASGRPLRSHEGHMLGRTYW